ncbi:MAG: hypothetical protein B7Z19_03920, partial [Polynucleobacter sp. 32-46-5]
MELPLGNLNTSDASGQVLPKETKISDKSSIIATLLAQSSRHLFGPTSAPALPLKHQVVSIEALISKLDYLKPDEVALIKKAFQFSDAAHLGQYRHSGEP